MGDDLFWLAVRLAATPEWLTYGLLGVAALGVGAVGWAARQ